MSVALNGLVMYGFTHPSLIYLLEQLPGAHRCHLYEFRYHREHAVSAADEDDDVSPSLFAICECLCYYGVLNGGKFQHIMKEISF